MGYCTGCGRKLPDTAKFCPACGGQTASRETNTSSQRQQEYLGKVKKCPNCGETLKSFEAICPACGHELNSSKVSDSLDSFIRQIEGCDRRIAASPEVPKKGWSTWGKGKKIGWVILNVYFVCIPIFISFLRPLLRTDKAPSLTAEEKYKATVIENFQFPNDRESILNALLFIKSKCSLLSTEKSSANNAYWMRLWINKANDLFRKSEMMFPGDSIAKGAIDEIHNNSSKVRKRQKVRLLGTVGIVAVFVLFILIRSGTFDTIKSFNTPLKIPDTALSRLMPQIEGSKGKVVINNSTYFTVDYYGISSEEFENYKLFCKDNGYTIDCESNGSLFEAYNDAGYNV